MAVAADWYGLPMPKVTDPSVPTSGDSQAPPEPAWSARTAASFPTMVLNFQIALPVAGVQGQQDPAARSVGEGTGQVDPAGDSLRLDTERALAAVEQTPVDPDRLAGCGAEREGRVRGVPVHPSVRDRHAVWPGAAEFLGVHLVLPPQLAGGEIEGVHVRLHVLDVDDAVDHDRRHGQRADAAVRLARDPERPGLLQLRDVGR